jgi:arylsulfatase A
LNPESVEYEQAFKAIDEKRKEHQKSVKQVPNQMALGLNPKLKVCCDWDSQKKYPDYPVCTCNPENYHVFVCSPVGPNEDYHQLPKKAEL